MKLLGILQRGPKRSNEGTQPTTSQQAQAHAASNNNNASTISPSRRKKQPNQTHAHAHAHTHARYESNSSIISIPDDHDDNTISANTLYEWSVADNAPSIGSAADLFHVQDKDTKDTSTKDLKKKKRRNNIALFRKDKDAGSSSDEDDHEGDDLEEDNDNDENVVVGYSKLSDSPPPKSSKFKNNSKNDDATPVRKGRGLFHRSTNSINMHTNVNAKEGTRRDYTPSPEKLSSPNRIKTRNQRKSSPSKLFILPVQSLRHPEAMGPVDVDSFLPSQQSVGPVDVDSFMNQGDVEVCMSNGKTSIVDTTNVRRTNGGDIGNIPHSHTQTHTHHALPAELKGRIHAIDFDIDDHLNSSYESNNSNSTSSSSSSMENSSVKNVGNANSPVKQKTASTKVADMSVFARNIGDININHMNNMNSPMHMFHKNVNVEPEFTFSITQEDAFGCSSDSSVATGTAWLLHDGNVGEDLLTKRQWELENLQADIQRDGRTGTVATEGAVADLDAHGREHGHGGTDTTNGKRFRNKVKHQMNKFQFVKKKNKAPADAAHREDGNGNVHANFNNSRLDKVKLKRDQSGTSMAPLASMDDYPRPRLVRHPSTSGVSMAPLTGIEDHPRPRLGKPRKDNELAREVERRKDIERREIERRHQEKQRHLDLERLQKQRLKDAEKWKAEAHGQRRSGAGAGVGGENENEKNTSSDAVIDPSESLERLKNRKKLQNWVMGVSNLSFDSEQLQQQQQFRKEEQLHQGYLPSVYDEHAHSHSHLHSPHFTATAKSPHTVATARINNRTKQSIGFNKGTFDFDANFPDEDSTAQTPEASAPTTHDFSCVLCKSGERTHLAVPCMHFSFCGECVRTLEQKQGSDMRCTVCNEEATKFSKVFY